MIDPLSALSLAAAIAQFTEQGCKLVDKAFQIYKSADGSLGEVTTLERLVASFQSVSEQVEASVKRNGQSSLRSTSHDAALDLARRCTDLAKRFLVFLRGLKVQGSTGKRASMKAAWAFTTKKRELEGFQKEFGGLQSTLAVQVTSLIYDRQSRLGQALDDISKRDKLMEVNLTDRLKVIRDALHKSTSQQSPQQLKVMINDLFQEARAVNASQQVLNSLKYEYMEARRSVIANQHAMTFEWVFATPAYLQQTKGIRIEFSDWLSNGNGIFWVSGKAGSGKSTLMKFLHDHPRTLHALDAWSSPGKLVTAAHFFWNAGTVMQKSQDGLLRSLCFEILRQCPDLIPQVCKERFETLKVQMDSRSWTQAEVSEVIERLTSHQLKSDGLPVRFCFFIDGLDEYDGDHADIISSLKRLACSTNIKICASSRPWNLFQNAFGECRSHMLVLQDLTREDIRLYTTNKFEEHPRFVAMQHDDPRCKDLISEVTEKAKGVFLWVALIMRQLLRSLDNADSLSDLQRRLEMMPPGLEEYFQHMFDVIDEFYKEQTAQMFRLCVRSRRPMTVLSFAVIDQDDAHAAQVIENDRLPYLERPKLEAVFEKRINGRCQDLLEVNLHNEVKCVDFIHRTVRDFLMTKDMDLLLKSRSGSNFNLLATLCLATMVALNHTRDATNSRVQEILDYASIMEEEQKATPYETLNRLEAAMTPADPKYNALPNCPVYSKGGNPFIPYIVQAQLQIYLEQRTHVEPSIMRVHRRPDLLWVAVSRMAHVDNGLVSPRLLELLQQHGHHPDASLLQDHTINYPANRYVHTHEGSISTWILFLRCIHNKHENCTGDVREQLLLASEMLIAGGASLAKHIKGINVTKGMFAEEHILTVVFGKEESVRLQSLRSQNGGWWWHSWLG